VTQYNLCTQMFGTNGLGQNGYGGGGRGSCGNGFSTIPSTCDAQPGSAGAVFVNFSFTCLPGSGAIPGFFSGSPCAPCLPGSYGAGTVFCLSCPPGFYCPAKSGTPVICPAGSYCPAKSGTPVKCDLCFLCSKEGLPQQLLCPSGHYCPSSVQDVPCPAGTFSSAEGAGSSFSIV
jgi:hypothetical protein